MTSKMNIQVNNQAGLPNKFVRLAKWKMYRVKEQFNQLLYSEIFISKEGKGLVEYHSVIKLGVPGYDIILKNKSHSPKALFKTSYADVVRYLRKNKERIKK